jgi:RNA polymerase sigma factor (sigma-70 family)
VYIEGDQRQSQIELPELYHRYGRWLTAAVRRFGGGEATDDIVQETYLRLVASEVTVIKHPKALLLRIAQNLLRNSARRDRATKRVPPTPASLGLREYAEADQFELIALRETILSLPEAYRDVFVLMRINGNSAREAGQALGLSTRATETRLAKALALCAERLRS